MFYCSFKAIIYFMKAYIPCIAFSLFLQATTLRIVVWVAEVTAVVAAEGTVAEVRGAPAEAKTIAHCLHLKIFGRSFIW